jgi:hypothetical protein
MSVTPFPRRRSDQRGCVHVKGDRIAGFDISDESASGSSWGHFFGPFPTGQEAITAAYALNRDVLGGECDVFVCDAAIEGGCPDVGLASLPGDF